MTVYQIRLINDRDLDVTIDAPSDRTIYEAANAANVNLPGSCRSGSCSSCAVQLIAGEVDQSEQSFLDNRQLAEGFILTCVAYPRAHCTIRTHQEDALY
jgi:ferredoxin